jgi:hypothetical protein
MAMKHQKKNSAGGKAPSAIPTKAGKTAPMQKVIPAGKSAAGTIGGKKSGKMPAKGGY